jgi:hypothetical protein
VSSRANARGDAPEAKAAARRRLAFAARDACRHAATAAWEEALAAGLCAEGAWEAAMGALSRLTPDEILGGAGEAE